MEKEPAEEKTADKAVKKAVEEDESGQTEEAATVESMLEADNRKYGVRR